MTVTVTRVSTTSYYGRCSGCPGVVIRWADRAAHIAAHQGGTFRDYFTDRV